MKILLIVLLALRSASGGHETSPFSGNSFFLDELAMVTFDQAREKCHDIGGTLARFESKDEQDWAWEQFSGDRNGSYWIGARNVPNSSVYNRWLDGTRIGYEVGLTPKYINSSCAALFIGRNNSLNNLSCDLDMYALCMMSSEVYKRMDRIDSRVYTIFVVQLTNIASIALVILALFIGLFVLKRLVTKKIPAKVENNAMYHL